MEYKFNQTAAPKFSMMVGTGGSSAVGVKLSVEGSGRIDFSPVISQIPTAPNALQSTVYWTEDSPTTYLLSVGNYSCSPCGIIKFQEGGAEVPNGTTLESVLHVVEHRLEYHQAGPCPCKENEAALSAVRAALVALNHRTEKLGRVS